MGKNKQAEPQEGWFQILEQCRELQAQKGGAFTSEDLSQFANLKGTPTTSSAAIASAWLGKFTAWGYLVRGEPIKIEGKVGRPTSTYLLTEDGMNCTERPGRLTRLIRAVISFAAARGTPKEAEAYKTLLETCRQVEKNVEGER